MQSPQAKSCLFTGDTLCLGADGNWQPDLLPGNHSQALAKSLGILRAFEPDVVLSSAFAGEPGFEENPADWQKQVERAIEQIQT